MYEKNSFRHWMLSLLKNRIINRLNRYFIQLIKHFINIKLTNIKPSLFCNFFGHKKVDNTFKK